MQPTEGGPDTVCVCNHWYEEHAEGSCAGCDAGDMDPAAIDHAFEFDPEGNTFESIADRGGEPHKWPQWMKDDPRYQEVV